MLIKKIRDVLIHFGYYVAEELQSKLIDTQP